MSDRPDAEVAVDDDEHVEEGDCCPFASPAVNLALLSAFCRWPPRPSSGKQIVGGAFERAVPTLLTFIDTRRAEPQAADAPGASALRVRKHSQPQRLIERAAPRGRFTSTLIN